MKEIGSMLDLQSLEASSDAIDPRASGASFMCNGDNSSVSLLVRLSKDSAGHAFACPAIAERAVILQCQP